MSLVLSNYNPYLSIVFRGIKNISNSYFPDVKFLYYNEAGIRMMLPLRLLLMEQYFKVKEAIEHTLRWLSSIDCKIIFIFSINT